jgi:alcohol dehydrogenase, propanol-preferring
VAMMPAYRLLDWGTTGYADVDVPEPLPGEVLVRVGGAGLCGSDVHFKHLRAGGWATPPPWTLGHENAGWVEANGVGALRFSTGDAVLATGIHSCSTCRACLRGDDNLCPKASGGRGAGMDGGFATYVVVPERELVALGSLDPRIAAPLADAGHTSYAAVKSALPKLTADTTALVIGAGGLGGYAIQYLKLLSPALVVVVEPSQARQSRAVNFGADEVVSPGANCASEVKDLTAGVGADVVIDFVGTNESVATALASAAVGGAVVLVGMGDATVAPLSFAQSPPAACHLYWQIGGNLRELAEVVTLAQRNLLTIDVEYFAFGDIEDGFARLEAGSITGRAVILPNG